MKMKRIWTFGLVVFLTGVLAAQNVKSLYIYHTNDMHSRVEPLVVLLQINVYICTPTKE